MGSFHVRDYSAFSPAFFYSPSKDESLSLGSGNSVELFADVKTENDSFSFTGQNITVSGYRDRGAALGVDTEEEEEPDDGIRGVNNGGDIDEYDDDLWLNPEDETARANHSDPAKDIFDLSSSEGENEEERKAMTRDVREDDALSDVFLDLSNESDSRLR